IRGRVAVTGVVRIGLETEAGRVRTAGPYLLRTIQLCEMVVLHSRQVPDQPPDRVRVSRWPRRELCRVEAVHRGARDRRHPAVQLEEKGCDVHGDRPWAGYEREPRIQRFAARSATQSRPVTNPCNRTARTPSAHAACSRFSAATTR